MAYISLFRKYRSENFDDLVGQEHIVRTISNAVRSGKIAQGYLFCGTRGTGKTTVARIIAKALNCEKGPTEHPCGECHICKSIKDGSCLDVIEMDAASNRSVEDVEKIVESVKYRPVECRYKVYIIDEAHQLSNQAKDAFLKTLEEPPEYVVFILATTEAHKIPVTIRSRCQQFDFKRGSLSDISGRIKYVCEKENVKISDDAVSLIARNANGSYRDSLSILEQIISFSGNDITDTEVYNVLGLVEEDVLFKISKSILESDIKQAFYFGENLIDRGKDIKEVLNNIASFYRDLLTVKINAADLGPHYKSECSNYSEKQLMDLISVFVEAQKDLRLSDQQRLTFELAFMQAIQKMKSVQQVKEVIVEKQVIKEVVAENTNPVSVQQKPLKVIQDTKSDISDNSAETEKKPAKSKKIIDFDKHIRKFWPRFVEFIRRGRREPQLAACLEAGVPTSYENEILTVTFKYGNEFQLDYCKEHADKLEGFLFECYSTDIKISFERFAPPPKEEIPEEKEETAAPDFAADAEIQTENEEEVPAVVSHDFDKINSVTVENPIIKNVSENNSEMTLDSENIEASDKTEKNNITDEVLSDSPLTEKKYEEHPKYEELKSVFPGAKETVKENNI